MQYSARYAACPERGACQTDFCHDRCPPSRQVVPAASLPVSFTPGNVAGRPADDTINTITNNSGHHWRRERRLIFACNTAKSNHCVWCRIRRVEQLIERHNHERLKTASVVRSCRLTNTFIHMRTIFNFCVKCRWNKGMRKFQRFC